MTTPSAGPRTLDDPPVPVQAKLSAAWATLMLLYLYVDYLLLYKPGVLDGLLAGRIFAFEISVPVMFGFLAAIGIPALMIVLAMALPARANRVVNLIVGAVYVPVTIFNVVGNTWEWVPFYVVIIAVELVILGFILRWAWAWPRSAGRPFVPATANVGERVSQ